MNKPICIRPIDLTYEAERRAVLDYLAPHEAHSLFIIGNLVNHFPQSHLYVAERASTWVGIGAYYAAPRSLIPFSLEPEVTRVLVHHIAGLHRPIEYLNGIGYAAWPALDALAQLGAKPVKDPRQVFMEMDLRTGELPHWPNEDRVRPASEADIPQLAKLLRQLSSPDDTSPLTERELAKARMQPERLVLEEAGQIVATASTNGLGLHDFQILGVATDPSFRRRGLARAVCAALVRRMQSRGARHAVLFTGAENEAALGCYRGMGFVATGDYCVAQFETPG